MMLRIVYQAVQNSRTCFLGCKPSRQAHIYATLQMQQAASISFETLKDRLVSILKRMGISQERQSIAEKLSNETSLDSMINITKQLLPEMTLTDKVLALDIMTRKIYSDIAEKSPIFHKLVHGLEINRRLYVEGKLEEVLTPKIQSMTLHNLVQGITLAPDHMTSWQVLKVFLNLQLLTWPRESKEMLSMFEQVEDLQVPKLNMEEMYMYLDSMNRYLPSQTAYWRKVHIWLDKCLENKELMDITASLTSLSMIERMQSNPQYTEFTARWIMEMTNQVNVEELTFQKVLILLKIIQMFTFTGSVAINLGFKMKILEQLKVTVSDLKIEDVIYFKHLDLDFDKDIGNSTRKQIGEKCSEFLEQEDLKYDTFLSCLLMAYKYNPGGLDLSSLKSKALHCIEKTDITGILNVFKHKDDLKKLGLYKDSVSRVVDFVMSGDLEKLPFFTRKLFLHIYHHVDEERLLTQVGDKYFDLVLKTHLFKRREPKEALLYWSKACQMTPKSMEFLENLRPAVKCTTNMLMNCLRDKLFPKKRHFPKFSQYKFKIFQMDYPRCNSILAILRADMVKKTCHDYNTKMDWNARFFPVVYDPVLQVLFTEKVRHLETVGSYRPYVLRTVYQSSLRDPEFLLNTIDISLNASQSLQKLLRGLLVDYYFVGSDSVPQEKIQEIISYLKEDDAFDDNVSSNYSHFSKTTKTRRMPFPLRMSVRKAFNFRTAETFFTDQGQFVDMMVLLDRNDGAVYWRNEDFNSASRHGLQKVAIFYKRNKLYSLEYAESQMFVIKDLERAGFHCVVIWEQELDSIAVRGDILNFIRRKVKKRSKKNTAAVLSYDFEKVKKGPYKDYFN